MEMENTRTSSASRIVIFIGILGVGSCILLVIILGIAGSMYQKQSEGPTRDQSTFTVTKSDLLDFLPLNERFPGYFRSQEEANEALVAVRTFTPVNLTANVSELYDATCDVSFSPDAIPFIPLSKAVTIHSCCCTSKVTLISPPWLVDIYGVNRTLATFNGAKQYFTQATCETINGCTVNPPCTCMINKILVSGVYIIDKTKYSTALFQINGCCQCMNKVTCSQV